ncbi:MAG TPA: response regulator transcription factor [Steroidobacteraceae bacterium]|nr:response regulator transcription factor [Steroidobacteraceae bacterium]
MSLSITPWTHEPYHCAMRILVVEDNDLVADAITLGLSAAGFAVDRSASAEAANSALATEHFDLLVVDVGLPGQDGLALVRRLRSRGATQPVLILTARDTLAIKVEALNLGADDFLLKPFEQDELIARCRALIRRANLYAGEQVNLGRMRLDVAGRMLRIDETAVDLTGREWLVLECLALNAGRVVSKERLQQAIASFDQALTPNAVEVYVSRVRAKLGDAAVIRTVRGLGYRLDDPST